MYYVVMSWHVACHISIRSIPRVERDFYFLPRAYSYNNTVKKKKKNYIQTECNA